jgi:hypothetical protein
MTSVTFIRGPQDGSDEARRCGREKIKLRNNSGEGGATSVKAKPGKTQVLK